MREFIQSRVYATDSDDAAMRIRDKFKDREIVKLTILFVSPGWYEYCVEMKGGSNDESHT